MSHMRPNHRTFSPEKLRTLRAKAGLTQRALGQRIGKTHAQIGLWEIGQQYPKLDTVSLLADFFGVPIEDLLDGGTDGH